MHVINCWCIYGQDWVGSSFNSKNVWRFRLLYPRSTKLEGGILVPSCLSVCQSMDRIVSALYPLQYLPDPFHIYTSFQAISEGVSRVRSLFQNSNI